MKPTPALVRAAEDLVQLAAQINRYHQKGLAAYQAGVEQFHAAGLALLKAKALVPHGGWLDWLAKNCADLQPREAHRYMALAKSHDAKNDTVSHLQETWLALCGRTPEAEEPAPSAGRTSGDTTVPLQFLETKPSPPQHVTIQEVPTQPSPPQYVDIRLHTEAGPPYPRVEDVATVTPAPAALWSKRQRQLRKALEAGQTVVLNLNEDRALLAWAQQAGLYVRVDRSTDWGNPFKLDEDGDRETVIANYRDHYLPCKKGLLKRLGELQGKALGCHCAPLPCHADVLAERANALTKGAEE
jgi:hypothetical protein